MSPSTRTHRPAFSLVGAVDLRHETQLRPLDVPIPPHCTYILLMVSYLENCVESFINGLATNFRPGSGNY
ncbi:hypothetical protein CH063_08352 [Colletotrichum higginsianum]|uniref:Uncharacterized protein n=1 Tax=Colletotrichum higginsianum (strain IMI 349063) TaxID=759273 RepID=H1V9I3_COLHI|nr:hypothetical protein CH063_08352 [Colletotrichum higginsianum]